MENCIFFQPIRDALRFINKTGTFLRNSYEYSWNSAGFAIDLNRPGFCDEFSTMYNTLFSNTTRKLKTKSRINYERMHEPDTNKQKFVTILDNLWDFLSR